MGTGTIALQQVSSQIDESHLPSQTTSTILYIFPEIWWELNFAVLFVPNVYVLELYQHADFNLAVRYSISLYVYTLKNF